MKMKCFPSFKQLIRSSKKNKVIKKEVEEVQVQVELNTQDKKEIDETSSISSIIEENEKSGKLIWSYINNNKNPTINETTCVNRYLQAIKKRGDKPYLAFYKSGSSEEPVRFTAKEFDARVSSVATGLYTTVGLNKGEVVGVYLPNCLPYIITEAAVEMTGFIMFQLNSGYAADQLERLIKKGKPSCIVTISKLLPNIRRFDENLKVILVDTPEHDNEHNNYSFDQLLKLEPDMELLDRIRSQIQPTDIMYYGCTSGSTGDPKICTYTNRQFAGNIMECAETATKSKMPEQRVCLFNPFYTTSAHILIGTMLLRGLFYSFLDKFDPEKIFQIIENDQITNISSAPSAYLALMYHPSRPKYNLSSLEKFMAGGAASSNDFLEKINASFNLIYCASCFGMTEACGLIYRIPVKSSGIPPSPINHFEIRIVDRETREIVKVGYPGELEFRSEIMMNEYLDNPEANKKSFTEDRWFKSGDEAILSEDGFLSITGRIKDLIIRGGHNIWPNEISDIINTHPKIQETAVIGIPDKFQGETVVAFVIVKNGCHFDNLEKELREFLQDKLVPFSIPTYYFALPELPRNSVRKVYTPKLKEMVKDLIKEKFDKLAENNNDKPVTDKGKEVAQLWSEWFDVPVGIISRSTNFFEMGGDSLVGVKTTGLLKKYYEKIPFNFLNTHQTLGEIEDFLLDPEANDVTLNKELAKDFEEIQSKSAQEIFGEINMIKKEDEKEESPRKCVAVTGATGYLGVHIVNELYKKKDIEKIYCIGRSANIGELKDKMVSTLRKAQINIKDDRIVYVLGDITKPNCGVESTLLEKIKKECHTFIHCAAVVNWNKTYTQLKKGNVTGVINAMKIAGTCMNFVYISSFGAALNKDESISDTVPHQSFAYIQTKWLAEHYVNKGKELGIQSTIIRPSYIISDAQTGICNTNDFIYKFIRQCVMNKMVPSNILLNLTPVDKVAKGVVDNMNAKTIINFVPEKQTSTDDLFKEYNEKYGQTVELLDKKEWFEKFMEITKTNEEALSIVPSLVAISKNYEISTSYLKGKNDFLNFEKSDIQANFNKLNESGFFTKEGCCSLIGRSG